MPPKVSNAMDKLNRAMTIGMKQPETATQKTGYPLTPSTDEDRAAQTRHMAKVYHDYVKLTDVKTIVNEITIPVL